MHSVVTASLQEHRHALNPALSPIPSPSKPPSPLVITPLTNRTCPSQSFCGFTSISWWELRSPNYDSFDVHWFLWMYSNKSYVFSHSIQAKGGWGSSGLRQLQTPWSPQEWVHCTYDVTCGNCNQLLPKLVLTKMNEWTRATTITKFDKAKLGKSWLIWFCMQSSAGTSVLNRLHAILTSLKWHYRGSISSKKCVKKISGKVQGLNSFSRYTRGSSGQCLIKFTVFWRAYAQG